MELRKYQRESRKYASTRHSPRERIMHWLIGLTGEVGELSEPIKKALFKEHHPKYYFGDGFLPSVELSGSIESEIGDQLWYLSQIATEFGLDLDEIAINNIRKLEKREQDGQNYGS